MLNENKSKKIFLLYSLIGLGFLIFLTVMLLTVLKSRDLPSLYAYESSKAQRGNIISADGFHIATTKKLYKAIVNNYYIDPQKKELFIQLFSKIRHGCPRGQRKIKQKSNNTCIFSSGQS